MRVQDSLNVSPSQSDVQLPTILFEFRERELPSGIHMFIHQYRSLYWQIDDGCSLLANELSIDEWF